MGPELEEKKEKNKIKREWQHLTCCINLTGDTLRQKKKFPQTLKSKFTRAPTLTKACFCKLTNTERKKKEKSNINPPGTRCYNNNNMDIKKNKKSDETETDWQQMT